MSNDHDHRGEYADQRHDHDPDYAAQHHRHYDLEREDDRLAGLLRDIDGQLGEVRGELAAALARITELEETQAVEIERADRLEGV